MLKRALKCFLLKQNKNIISNKLLKQNRTNYIILEYLIMGGWSALQRYSKSLKRNYAVYSVVCYPS